MRGDSFPTWALALLRPRRPYHTAWLAAITVPVSLAFAEGCSSSFQGTLVLTADSVFPAPIAEPVTGAIYDGRSFVLWSATSGRVVVLGPLPRIFPVHPARPLFARSTPKGGVQFLDAQTNRWTTLDRQGRLRSEITLDDRARLLAATASEDRLALLALPPDSLQPASVSIVSLDGRRRCGRFTLTDRRRRWLALGPTNELATLPVEPPSSSRSGHSTENRFGGGSCPPHRAETATIPGGGFPFDPCGWRRASSS